MDSDRRMSSRNDIRESSTVENKTAASRIKAAQAPSGSRAMVNKNIRSAHILVRASGVYALLFVLSPKALKSGWSGNADIF